MLWLRSTARAMWRMLASEPCLVDDVLKTLLRVQREGVRQHGCQRQGSCCRFLAVSVWMRPAPLHPGLHAPLQPFLPSPPAPKPGPPQGRLGQGPRGHSQAGLRAARESPWGSLEGLLGPRHAPESTVRGPGGSLEGSRALPGPPPSPAAVSRYEIAHVGARCFSMRLLTRAKVLSPQARTGLWEAQGAGRGRGHPRQMEP